MLEPTRRSRVLSKIDSISLWLIASSLINLSISTLPGLSSSIQKILNIIESVITIFFTIEYIARIVLEKNKKEYIFSFYGVVDLIAILPFFLTLGTGFETIRAVRLIRIFRILKFARQRSALNRIFKAIRYAKNELIVFLWGTIILLYLSAAGIYVFENKAQPEVFKSIFHSLWWAVATLTTVGYGDIYPVTFFGRMFTFIILMIGVGIISSSSGIMVNALQKVIEEEKINDNKED